MSLLLSIAGDDNAVTNIRMIPVDLMVHIDSFMEISDRVRLAATSKPVRKFIYEVCVPLWEDIDLSKVSYQYEVRDQLNDERLASLLIQVNARTVTRSLNLDSVNVRGTGILPLTGLEYLRSSICGMVILVGIVFTRAWWFGFCVQ